MHNIYIYIVVMAVVTYLIRVLPLTLIRKEIKSPFIRSFLFYVPYATLATMTFPAILMTDGLAFAACLSGFAVALILSYKKKSLLIVAAGACIGAFIVQLIMDFLL